jgi:uncharacterized protein (TIGR03437 family)
LLLLAAAGSCFAQPFIFHRGILNAASYAPGGLPNGAIARGSIFSIFGRNLGPPQSPPLSSFPLQTALGGVSIAVCQNANCVAAIPLFVTPSQINAIMPSNAPLGPVSLRVTYNGQAGGYSPATVTAASLGIFAVNSGGFGPGIVQNFLAQDNQPINSALTTARPGQIVTLWGTGLGPGLNADNVAPQAGDLPVAVDIFVGGKRVTSKLYSGRTPCCAGVDQIVFQIPADAPAGCYVPVQVRTAGQVTSNTVTIAIHPNGEACSDPANPLQSRFVSGGNLGVALFERARTLVDLDAAPAAEADIGAATVSTRKETGSPFFYNPFLSLPPPGSCAAWSVRGNIFGDGELPGLRATGGALSSGQPLRVDGASGADFATGRLDPDLRATSLNFASSPSAVTLSSPGGQDVGAFNVTVAAGEAVSWTNRARIVDVDRAAPLAIAFTAQPGASVVVIAGGNYDLAADASGTFLCLAAAGSTAFEVPAHILSVVPPSWLGAAIPLGRLFVGAVPQGGVNNFQATGLDAGVAVFLQTAGKTVSFR